MKKFEISEQVVIGLLQYLLTRPMHEVEAGVSALRQLKEIVEQEVRDEVKQ